MRYEHGLTESIDGFPRSLPQDCPALSGKGFVPVKFVPHGNLDATKSCAEIVTIDGDTELRCRDCWVLHSSVMPDNKVNHIVFPVGRNTL